MGLPKPSIMNSNHIKFRCVDYDQETSLETILSEIKTEIQDFEVAYRMNEEICL